ncbi:MAG: hypothetical protein LBD02_05055 [Christensenellaceae bacterium]|jgi:hypothetical protein|nr:hypothetical protein [Christensenellaceae bacterium]
MESVAKKAIRWGTYGLALGLIGLLGSSLLWVSQALQAPRGTQPEAKPLSPGEESAALLIPNKEALEALVRRAKEEVKNGEGGELARRYELDSLEYYYVLQTPPEGMELSAIELDSPLFVRVAYGDGGLCLNWWRWLESASAPNLLGALQSAYPGAEVEQFGRYYALEPGFDGGRGQGRDGRNPGSSSKLACPPIGRKA